MAKIKYSMWCETCVATRISSLLDEYDPAPTVCPVNPSHTNIRDLAIYSKDTGSLRQRKFEKVSTDVSTNNQNWADLISQNITIGTEGIIYVFVSISASDTSANQSAYLDLRLLINGDVHGQIRLRAPYAGQVACGSIIGKKSGLDPGTYTVLLRWKSGSTGSAYINAASENDHFCKMVVDETSNT